MQHLHEEWRRTVGMNCLGAPLTSWPVRLIFSQHASKSCKRYSRELAFEMNHVRNSHRSVGGKSSDHRSFVVLLALCSQWQEALPSGAL